MKRTKILIFILLLLGLNLPKAQAQNWDEWFHQEWTQGEYHKEQIGGLWLFLDKVSDGLGIVGKGLTTISNISNDNFNLHRDFFSSLSSVKSTISNSAKVVDIFVFQVKIVRDTRRIISYIHDQTAFSPAEILYVERVCLNLLVLTDANMTELLSIIQIGDKKMTDDERLSSIDRYYDELQEQRAFVNAFGNEVMVLGRERMKQQHEIDGLKKYYSTY